MDDLTGLLWQALTAEVGLEIVTSNPEAFKRKFYATRAKAREDGNYSFDELSLLVPPADQQNKLWIVHNGQTQEKDLKDGQTQPKEEGGTREEDSPPVQG